MVSRGSRPTAIAVGYTVIGALPMFLVSAQSVRLQEGIGLGPAHLGTAISAYFLVSSAASAPLGHLVERVGPTVGLRAAAALSALALLGISQAATWIHVAAFLAVSGLANAVVQVSTNLAVAGNVRPERQGVSFGMKQAAVPVASLLAGAALPLVALAAGWRWTFAGAAGLAIAAAALTPSLTTAGSLRRRLIIRPSVTLSLLALAGALAGMAASSLVGFTVAAAVRSGIGEGPAGGLFAVASAAAIVVRVAVGWAVDRSQSGGFGEMTWLMVIGAAGFALLAAATHNPVLFAAGVVVGLGAGWGWTGLIYYVVVRHNRERPAAASGLVLSSVYLGMVVGPVLTGLLVTSGGYRAGWVLGGVLLVTAAAAVLAGRLSARRAA